MGGGGGVLEVTLAACRMLPLRAVVIMTTFGTGGSSGRLREFLRPRFGEVPSPGNVAASLQRAAGTRQLDFIFEHRMEASESRSIEVIVRDLLRQAQTPLSPAAESIARRIVRLAGDWDRDVRGDPILASFHHGGHSIRNIVVLWHWLLRHGVLAGRNRIDAMRMESAMCALNDWFELDATLVLPVSVESGTLMARYTEPVPEEILDLSGLDASCLGDEPRVVLGQHPINVLRHSPIGEFDLRGGAGAGPRPRVFSPVLIALKSCRLIIVGGGSWFTSLQACLAVRGVLQAMLERPDIPRVLAINPYHLDQTRGLSFRDLLRSMKSLANRVLGETSARRNVRVGLGDLFSDVIVNRPCSDRSGAADSPHRVEQDPAEGEARGWIQMTGRDRTWLERQRIRVHHGQYTLPQRKQLKCPGNRFIEIEGYDALRISAVLARILARSTHEQHTHE